MKILVADADLRRKFTNIIAQNEIGGNMALAYEFTDAGGRSGYSFGITQIDVNSNPFAGLALRDLEFTTDECSRLKNKTIKDLSPMNARLLAHKDIVANWDMRQISECLSWPTSLLADHIDYATQGAFCGICDYHNQFNLSKGGKLYTYLMALKTPVTLEMIRDFKLALPSEWAQSDEGQKDIWRRYKTILKLAV